jgi:hypothetical protein
MSEAKKLKPVPKRKLSDSARKRNKKAANAKLSKNRIYIGDEYDRWMEIKTALRLETNSEVAKILLDRLHHFYCSGSKNYRRQNKMTFSPELCIVALKK